MNESTSHKRCWLIDHCGRLSTENNLTIRDDGSLFHPQRFKMAALEIQFRIAKKRITCCIIETP